jgi:hypothetical protein
MAPKRKPTPTKQKSNAKAGQRYSYTQLSNVALTSSAEHHVYGVIIDATFPYKVNKDRFVCSLKVVDNSLNGAGKSADYASIVIYATRFEDLPIVHRIGDIIRVHRAALRLYDDKRQFNVNVQWNGSWALFSTDKNLPLADVGGHRCGDNEPFCHSGKRATFEKHEVGILSALRKWSSSYFAGHDGVTKDMYRALSKAKGAREDFDVVAKITQVHNFDEFTNELRLTDSSGDSWFTLATKLKFPHLRSGACVRVRSVTYDESSSNKNMLSQSHYSNIMTFISGSRLCANLGKVSHNNKAEAAALKSDAPSNHAMILSEVAAKYANMPFTSLIELFHSANTSGTTFRVQLQVLAVQPGDVREMVKVLANGKAASAKGAKGGNLFWEAQLLCKDASTADKGNQYKILNYSHEGLGANFFGKAVSLHDNASARAGVEAKVADLTRFNSWVDAIVERKGGFYHIRDTKLVHCSK